MLTRLVARSGRLLLGVAGIGICLMLVLVFLDVLSRLVFNYAIPGVDTVVASYLMVATIFLPLAMLQLLDENIAVDALRDRMPDFVKDIFDVVAQILSAAFYGVLCWLFLWVAVEAIEIREYATGAWNVPIWPARIFMPIGLFLGALAALVKLFQAVGALVSGAPAPDHHSSGSV